MKRSTSLFVLVLVLVASACIVLANTLSVGNNAIKLTVNTKPDKAGFAGTVALDIGGKSIAIDSLQNDLLKSYASSLPCIDRKPIEANPNFLPKVKTMNGVIELDLTELYAKQSITSLTRRISWNQEQRTLMITDTAIANRPIELASGLVTTSRPRTTPNNLMFYSTSEGNFLILAESTQGEAYTILENLIKQDETQFYRIGALLAKPENKVSLSFIIKPLQQHDGIPKTYLQPAGKLDWDGTITIETENPIEETGGKIKAEPRPGASGKAFMFWDKQGHMLTWEFKVETPGNYAVLVRCAHPRHLGAARSAAIDNIVLADEQAPAILPGTGGWSGKLDQWENFWLVSKDKHVIANLTPGTHRLTMTNVDNNGVNLDWVKLVRIVP